MGFWLLYLILKAHNAKNLSSTVFIFRDVVAYVCGLYWYGRTLGSLAARLWGQEWSMQRLLSMLQYSADIIFSRLRMYLGWIYQCLQFYPQESNIDRCPGVFPEWLLFIYSAYSTPSTLFLADVHAQDTSVSRGSIQQGDLLGLLLFAIMCISLYPYFPVHCSFCSDYSLFSASS